MTIHMHDIASSCFLRNEFGDSYLYEVNHNALNKLGAEQLHKQRFAKLIKQEDGLLIFVGSDSGTLLKYLSQNEIATGTRIIIVELPEIYDTIKKDLPDFEQYLDNDNIYCITYNDFYPTVEEIGIQKYIYIGTIKLTQSLAADDAFIPEYQELSYNLQTDLQQLSWSIQASLGSEEFLKKQLKNLGENIRSATCLRGGFRGKTAVLLAGGPSLDDILPWVQKNRSNIVILAVSRVCRRLQEIGLQPDIIFSIDPNQVSFDVSKDMLSYWKSSLFVHANHVSPQLLGQWQGRNLYLGNRFPWKTDLNQETLPHPGPTVSNVALAVAVEMGFSQIILAGVDLCFSPKGYTHAQGSNESKAGPQLGKICAQVETYGGSLAESTSDFVNAMGSLDAQASEALEKGSVFINPSLNAAKIEHVQHQLLQDITLTPLTENPTTTLETLVTPTTRDERKTYYQKIIHELTKTNGQLLQIRKLATEALRCNDGLFGRNGRKRSFKNKKRMDKIERSLNKKHASFARLVKEHGIRHFLSLTRIKEEAEWDNKELEETTRKYYEAYKNSASALISLVQQSKQRLHMRLEEENDSPDYTALTKHWIKDKQPGRSLVWLTRQKKTLHDIPATYQQSFIELKKSFQSIICETETSHMKRSRKFADLDGIMAKTKIFFRQQNAPALKQLKKSLATHPDANAENFLFQVQGYLYELVNEPTQAMAQYEKLFESKDEALIEDALRRVSSISIAIKDYQNALLALETLSSISPNYLRQYGELLRLLGKHQDALNIYLDYLEKVPGDMTTMIAVGKYYRELQIEEGAQAMFQHVLSQDPENATVKKLLKKAA